MAQSSECNKCDFSFLGGHSHDAGYSEAICINCFSKFALPTQNSWGPQVTEIIELHEVKTINSSSKKERRSRYYRPEYKLIPTGVHLVVEVAVNSNGSVCYQFETLACPRCKAESSIKGYFENHQPCPQCNVGFLECDNDVEC